MGHVHRIEPYFKDLIPDFIKDYLEIIEETKAEFPLIFGPLLPAEFLVDCDCAHDLKIWQSITGLVDYVGSTSMKHMAIS